MSNKEYFHITNWKKDEKNRDIRGNLICNDVLDFTVPRDVPIVKVNTDAEDDEDVRLDDKTT
mgnify:CR=1 FL=1